MSEEEAAMRKSSSPQQLLPGDGTGPQQHTVSPWHPLPLCPLSRCSIQGYVRGVCPLSRCSIQGDVSGVCSLAHWHRENSLGSRTNTQTVSLEHRSWTITDSSDRMVICPLGCLRSAPVLLPKVILWWQLVIGANVLLVMVFGNIARWRLILSLYSVTDKAANSRFLLGSRYRAEGILV